MRHGCQICTEGKLHQNSRASNLYWDVATCFGSSTHINANFFILPGFVGQVFVLAPGSSKSVWNWSVARKRKCNMSRKNTFDVIWYPANMIDIVSEWTYDCLDIAHSKFILHMHWMIVSWIAPISELFRMESEWFFPLRASPNIPFTSKYYSTISTLYTSIFVG